MDRDEALEFLRVAFDLAEECSKPEKAIKFSFSEDREGQGHDIVSLAYIATIADEPHETKLWAFNKLAEIAKHYRENGELDSIPPPMVWWSLGIASGDIGPPKRGKGHPKKNVPRDHMIVGMVGWLTGQGETKKHAIELVARVVEERKKANKPRASFGPDAVATVLKKKK